MPLPASIIWGNFSLGCGAFDEAERWLALAMEEGDDFGQLFIQWHLAHLACQREDFVATCDHAQQALNRLEDHDSFFVKAHVLNWLGHGRIGLQEYSAAAEAYTKSRVLSEQEGRTSQMMESMAGLARVALLEGVLTVATEYVETLLDHIQHERLDGADDRFRVYLTCYEVLDLTGDDRAQVLLKQGYELLQAQADLIEDEELRHTFLFNIPAHRALIDAYEQTMSSHPRLSSTQQAILNHRNYNGQGDIHRHARQSSRPPHSSDLLPIDALANQQLFGVAELLAQLTQTILRGTHPWLVAIEGIGGIGKTTLATVAIAQTDIRRHFADVLWISARQEEFLPDVGIRPLDQPVLDVETLVDLLLAQLGGQSSVAGDTAAKRSTLLHRLQEAAYLIVVDNLDSAADIEALLPFLQQLANPSKVLMTSRFSLRTQNAVASIPLAELSRNDTHALIRYQAELSNIAPLSQATAAQLDAIYGVVGGNPLAIKLVVGQLHFLSLSQVLESLQSARGKRVDELYTYIYWQAWQMLDNMSRSLFLALPLIPDGSFDELAAISKLEPDDVIHALEQLTRLSLVQVSGGLEERVYRLHSLTETFLMNEVLKWQAAV